MPVCAVFGCKTNHNNIKGTGMKFHSFPRDPVYEKLWIDACKRSDPLPKQPRICSLHFKQDSYRKPLIQTLLNYTSITSRNLKPDAIPTENMPDKSALPGSRKVKRSSQTNESRNNGFYFTPFTASVSVRNDIFLEKNERTDSPIVINKIRKDNIPTVIEIIEDCPSEPIIQITEGDNPILIHDVKHDDSFITISDAAQNTEDNKHDVVDKTNENSLTETDVLQLCSTVNNITDDIQNDTAYDSFTNDIQHGSTSDTSTNIQQCYSSDTQDGTTSNTQDNGQTPEVKILTTADVKWRTEVGILCRLCTKSDYSCVPIFSGHAEKLELETKIMKYLQLEVKPGDKLPNQVCRTCLEAVTAWHEFAISCFNAQKKLKELLFIKDKVFPSKTIEEIKKKHSESKEKKNINKQMLNTQGVWQNMQNSFAVILLGNSKPINVIHNENYGNKTEKCVNISTSDHNYASNDQEILKEATVQDQERNNMSKDNLEEILYKCNVCSETFCNYLQYAAHKMAAHKMAVYTNEAEVNKFKQSEHSSSKDFPEGNTLIKQVDKENRTNKERLTTCPVCYQQFTKLNFKKHLPSHPGLCDKCFKIIPDENDLEEHKLHHAKAYLCEICGKRFSTKTNLKNHLNTHLPDSVAKKFKCPKCDATFRWRRTIEIHDALKHSDQNVNVCPICHQKFINARYIKQHIKEIHTLTRSFTCQKCDKSFKNKRYLRQHERTHSRIPRPPKCKDNQQDKVKCDKCGRYFDSRIGLTLHSRTDCTLTTSRMCYICGRILNTSVQYHAHISKHKTKSFKCSYCNKSFFSKFERNVHIQRHKEERLYSCEICDKSFITKYNLIAHSTIHTNSKPFQCHICDKTFRQKSFLTEHIRVHNNDKRYKCEVCGMAFVKSCDMKKHIKTHFKMPSRITKNLIDCAALLNTT